MPWVKLTDDWYEGSTPLPLGREVMPLSDFPEGHRQRIAEQVLEPKPPERWLHLGPAAQIHSRAWYEWHWHRGIDPDKKRGRLPSHLRELVIERDGLTCGLCGNQVERDDVHIDHIKPVARGGSDDPDNLQVAHSICNIKKGASYSPALRTGGSGGVGQAR